MARGVVLAPLLVAALAGCDDFLFNHGETELDLSEQGYCGVLSIVAAQCLSCHSANLALGGLDLQTDPHAAMVGVASVEWGGVLVEPHDPQGSLLIRKLDGSLGMDEGGVMPPAGLMDEAAIRIVHDWVADGAPSVCESGGPDPTGGGRVHPVAWSAPSAHGLATKLQSGAVADCRVCHGQDLEGGESGISCTLCHTPGWEADCTFCHGSQDPGDGAPPRDIDGETDLGLVSFAAHRRHLETDWAADATCETCHGVVLLDALQAGHLFDDDTPGQAEISFTEVSAGGSYTFGSATCGVYCHGDGQGATGTVTAAAGSMSCTSCHAARGSSEDALEAMSGQHKEHIASQGLGCSECHGAAVDATDDILLPGLHVNGVADVQLPSTMTRDPVAGTCLGLCHVVGEDEPVEHSLAEKRFEWAP